MTAPTLEPYLARGQRLQAILMAQIEAQDHAGEIETMTKMVELLETIVFLDLLPCNACGGDRRTSEHWDSAACRWRCLPESEVDL